MRTVLILLVLAGTARADSLGDARQLAASAQAHFDVGEYGEAIVDYRAAYRLVPTPGLLYDLGQAYRLAGDCPNARTMYKSYLRRAPHSPYRGLVVQHLSELGGCLRVSTIQGAPPPLPPPRVESDDQDARAEPRHHRLWLGIATAVVGLAAGAAVYWYEREPALTPLPMPGKGWSF